jgi:hypothetical protein
MEDLSWGLNKQIFCFDLVRGMDCYKEPHGLVYADVLEDSDFHNDKKQPKIGHTDEVVEHNIETYANGQTWYFDESYSSNGDFRSTFFNGAKITHGWNEQFVIVDIHFEKIIFYLIPNQAEIRALLTLLNLKYSNSITALMKLPIEMFRLIKNFLI